MVSEVIDDDGTLDLPPIGIGTSSVGIAFFGNVHTNEELYVSFPLNKAV